ncbi:MAG: LysM peptidoglycan-binding domain-containing protein [Planctomycetes bacterium]|nr:LysM peptidoglycan-binding domain-containing protein [Planctomycetota bacterium]
MQRIEKYAVIALVLLLVTILAVSLWSQKKGKSPFSFFKKGTDTSEVAQGPGATDPAAATGFETTQIGAQPQTGLAPIGEQTPQNLDPRVPPAGWKPGEPWVNRGRVAAQTHPNDGLGEAVQQPSTQPVGFDVQRPTSGFVADEVAVRATPSAEKSSVAPAKKPAAKKSTVAAGPTYVVQGGDTLGEIAQRELGSFDKWSDIAALNGNLDPKKLKKGMKIVLPAGAKSASKPKVNGTGAVAPGGEYVVQKGDTLSGIAQKLLGKSARWTEIASLNPSIDPKRLIVGAHLRLPKGVAVRSSNVAKAESKNRVR